MEPIPPPMSTIVLPGGREAQSRAAVKVEIYKKKL
jgi:hypothetical protein